MMFPCSKCGACCTRVGRVVEQYKKYDGPQDFLIKSIKEFPHKYDSSGRCDKLNDDNTCQVYDNRPPLCNVDTMFISHYSKFMSKEEFYAVNTESCNALNPTTRV
jgi:Fe-S-cluster containining protein